MLPNKQRLIFSVSQITQDIKLILENTFGEVWVEGEVSNFRPSSAGHFYFSLKDNAAVLQAAMFSYANKTLQFKIEDGQKLICFGKIDVYPPRGQYQLIVEKVEPKGLGAQQLALEQLKQKLQKEGLFDPEHKRKLPKMVFSVGVVTSSAGAALRDILQVLKRGAPCADVIIRSVRVQGEFAAGEISEAIEDLNQFGKSEVIILSRGGGSSEDLMAFNQESVARAIYKSHIPIISAVGHQINTTISDLVADVFVETPTAAAKIIVEKRLGLLNEIEEARQGLHFYSKEIIGGLNNSLTALRHMLKSPKDRLQEKQQLLDELNSAINVNMRHILDLAREKAVSFVKRLDSLSPLGVLSRGYSLSSSLPQGAILKDAAVLKPGDLVKTILEKGFFTSVVREVNKNE